MLTNGKFWVGVLAGVGGVYAYRRWATRKASQ